MTSIYSLHEDTGELRYIGKTIHPLASRLRSHFNTAKSGLDDYRCRWIRRMKKCGRLISIRLIEQVSGDGCAEEIFWIEHHKKHGTRLVNTTAGGEGLLNPAPSVRKKIGDAHRGKSKSPEHRLELSTAQQLRFQRDSVFVFRGERGSLAAFSRRFGISDSTVWQRIKRGDSLESALTGGRKKGGRPSGGIPPNKLLDSMSEMIGRTFGKLTVVDGKIRRTQGARRTAFIFTKCVCGKESWKDYSSLVTGGAGCRSCGGRHPCRDGKRQLEMQ